MSGLVLAAVREGVLEADQQTTRSLAVHQLGVQKRHERLAEGVAAVGRRLSDISVRWMVVKGLGSEARWYDAVGERPATDVDILVDASDASTIRSLTRALDPDLALVDTAAEAVGSGHLQHLELTVEDVPVDLHTDFLKVGVPTRQHKHLWTTAGRVDFAHGSFRVPSPEWALIGQVLHLTKDGFSYLGPVLEIERIASTPGLDWELVRALVAGEGAEVPFWAGLARVGAIVDRPEMVHDVGGWRSRVWMTTWPESGVLQGREGRAEAPTRQMWLAATFTGRRRQSVRELKRQFLPSRDLVSVAEGQPVAAGRYLRRLTVDRARRVASRRRESTPR